MESPVKRLILKKHWDSIWSDKLTEIDNTDIHPVFIGRGDEVNRLSGLLGKRGYGAIFIGGNYGSGKTSTTLRAITLLKRKPIVVAINHLLLDPIKKDEELVYEIIRQMVRSLYSKNYLKNNEQLLKLFNDLTLTKYLRKGSIDEFKSVKKSIDINSTVNSKIKSILKNNLGIFVFVFTTLISLLNIEITSNFFSFFNTSYIKIISSIIFGLLSTILVKISLKYTYSKIDKTSELHEIEGISIHELQNRLHLVLKSLEKEEKRDVIFIFEELDQYDNNSQYDNTEEKKEIGAFRLLKLLKSLKLLFHNSSATFIFLIGLNTYNLLSVNPYKTIPTEKFYISKASPTEIMNFLDNIVESRIPKELSKEILNMYKALLIRYARGNFYDLKQILRERRRFTSVLEANNEREVIFINDLTSNERYQASLILALLPYIERFNESQREIVFEGLLKVVEHFEYNIHNSKLDTINDLPDDVNAKNVMVSFLEQVFKVGKRFNPNINIPHFEHIVHRQQILDIDWELLRKSLPNENYELLYTNQIGAILTEEVQFTDQYRQLLSSIRYLIERRLFSNRNITSIKDGLLKLIEKVGLPNSDAIIELAQNVDMTYVDLQNTKLSDRSENWYSDLLSQHIPNIQKIEDYLNYYLIGSNFLLVKGSAEIRGKEKLEIILKESPHQPGVDFGTIIKYLNDVKQINKLFKLEIPPGGIVNFLFGTKPWINNLSKQEFFMVRFDHRPNANHGILFKGYGENSWKQVQMLKNKEELDEEQFIYIKFSNGNLKIDYPRGHRLNYKIGQVSWFGIANELSTVKIITDSSDDNLLV